MNGMASSTSFPVKEESKWLRVGTDEVQDNSRGRSRFKEADDNMLSWNYTGEGKTASFDGGTAGKDKHDLYKKYVYKSKTNCP